MAWNSEKPNDPWASSWTSANGLTTTGTQNPFGLNTNSTGGVIDPYTGYNTDPQLSNTIADNSANVATTPYTGNIGGDGFKPSNTGAPDPRGYNTPADPLKAVQAGWSSPANIQNAAFTNTPQTPQPQQPQQNPYIASNGQYQSTGGAPIQASSTKDLYGNAVFNPQAQQQKTSTQTPFSFLQGGQVADPLFPNGQPVNSGQYATPQSAQEIAKLFGGQVVSSNITSQGGAFTNDQQEIMLPNGLKVNAGLIANLINNQGLEAAKKIIQQDMAGFGQAPAIDPRNLQPQQGLPVGGNQGGNNTNDFMSQIMGLYALLQKFGIGTQRPPLMPSSANNSNYFTQFA